MSHELLVSRLGGRVATALREAGEIVELRVEDDTAALSVGDVLKGRVTRVLPGLQAAFVDVGTGPDAFLHAADLHLPGEAPIEGEVAGALDGETDDDVEAGRRPHRRSTGARPPIEDRLAAGRDLVVQVSRTSLGSKGPRVTTLVTLAGRYLVFTPRVLFRGVSRRIADEEERDRLRGLVRALPPPEAGFIVRTAGAQASPASFEADAADLARTWREIGSRAERIAAPARLHADGGLFLRTLRDAPGAGWDGVVIEGRDLLEAGRSYLAGRDPELAGRLSLHAGELPLFDQEGVHAEIDRALRPRVWLRSGGTIVIEPTEALVSIDVNTGKNTGSSRPEDTILKTNLEAAEEIARQIRLRDLGGIIVIDFVDMEREEHRTRVVEALQTALRRDRARTKVLGLSELGLLQLTRKRTRAGLRGALTRPCPACAGGGSVKTPDAAAHEALVEARRVLSGFLAQTVVVRAHPDVARALRTVLEGADPTWDRALSDRIAVESDARIDPDRFDLRAG